jgi:hypothetical protein
MWHYLPNFEATVFFGSYRSQLYLLIYTIFFYVYNVQDYLSEL